jgi:hypothetical protein
MSSMKTSRVVKERVLCFASLSTSGKRSMISVFPPFTLRFSKGERWIFHEPVSFDRKVNLC